MFLCMTKIEFLGHMVFADGVRMDPNKFSVILAWPMLENIPALRSFLGLSGYYHRFIEFYSLIATPMIDLSQE